jgi:hypothetical protein
MKFNEIKKNKDTRVVKPRDPNFKVMQDIKKSGASGSHGDKTKVIPRKEKYKEVPEDGWKDDYKVSRLLGKAQASMAHGLELAESVLKGDKDMSIIKARVIKENWPELIDQLNKVYDTKTDLNSIHEYVDDRVGTVVKTVQGKRVKIVQADPKKGVYKVDLGNGHEKWVTTKQLDLEVPMDALGKKAKPRSDLKHPWDSDPKESKEEMCPEACCGVPVSECNCPPDCPHCDCNAINETFVLYDKKTGKRHNAKDKETATAMIAKNKNLEIKGQKWNEKVGDT